MEYLRKVDWSTLDDKAQFLLDRSTGATTCKIVISKRKPGSQSPRGVHTHSFDQILYVLSGRLWVEIGGQEYVAEPGTLVVQPAGEPTGIGSPTTRPSRRSSSRSSPPFRPLARHASPRPALFDLERVDGRHDRALASEEPRAGIPGDRRGGRRTRHPGRFTFRPRTSSTSSRNCRARRAGRHTPPRAHGDRDGRRLRAGERQTGLAIVGAGVGLTNGSMRCSPPEGAFERRGARRRGSRRERPPHGCSESTSTSAGSLRLGVRHVDIDSAGTAARTSAPASTWPRTVAKRWSSTSRTTSSRRAGDGRADRGRRRARRTRPQRPRRHPRAPGRRRAPADPCRPGRRPAGARRPAPPG